MAGQGVGRVGRVCVLAGAVAVAVSVALPWIRIRNAMPGLRVLGVPVGPADRTMTGLDTSIWPVVVGVAAIVGLLALLGRARLLAAGLGGLAVVAGIGLLYYLAHVVELRTRHQTYLERTVAHLAVRASLQPGPVVLLAGGTVALLGALLSRPWSGR